MQLRGTSGQKEQSYPLTQSNDPLWPEGRKGQGLKKINALGHMHTQMDAVVKDWEHPGEKTLVFCSFMTPAPLSCIDGHSGCCVETEWPAASCCRIHQKQPWIKQAHTEGMGRKALLRTCSIMVPCLLQLPTRWAGETSLLSSAPDYLYHQKIGCNNNSSLWLMQ